MRKCLDKRIEELTNLTAELDSMKSSESVILLQNRKLIIELDETQNKYLDIHVLYLGLLFINTTSVSNDFGLSFYNLVVQLDEFYGLVYSNHGVESFFLK